MAGNENNAHKKKTLFKLHKLQYLYRKRNIHNVRIRTRCELNLKLTLSFLRESGIINSSFIGVTMKADKADVPPSQNFGTI